jgi:hypothetical protein
MGGRGKVHDEAAVGIREYSRAPGLIDLAAYLQGAPGRC